MLFVYTGDGKRIELSTAVGIAGSDSGGGFVAFIDSGNRVVARLHQQDITAFSKVDLGPALQRASSNSNTQPISRSDSAFNHDEAASPSQLAQDIEAMNVPVPVAAFLGELESTPMPE